MYNRRSVLAGAAAAAAPAFLTRAFAATSGVSDREIVLGQSAVLSGPLGASVNSFNAGARLAFDEINRRGGLAGRRIRIESLDDELKPDKAVANYKTLLTENKVFAFFGGVGSGTIAAATPILRESNAPLIGNYAVGDGVREKAKDAAYFVRASYGREAEKLIELLGVIGNTRIAVAHLANPGGDEVLARVRALLKAKSPSLEVAASAGVKNDGSNAAEAARTIAAGQPQAVIMFLSGSPIATLMKTLWDSGSNPAFYGMSTVAGDMVVKALGDQVRGGLSVAQVVPYAWADSDAPAREFRALCSAAKVEVSYNAFEGWINAMVAIEALRRAGRDLTRESLHGVMRSMKTRVAGMDLDFTGASPTGSRFVELVHVRAGGRYLR